MGRKEGGVYFFRWDGCLKFCSTPWRMYVFSLSLSRMSVIVLPTSETMYIFDNLIIREKSGKTLTATAGTVYDDCFT